MIVSFLSVLCKHTGVIHAWKKASFTILCTHIAVYTLFFINESIFSTVLFKYPAVLMYGFVYRLAGGITATISDMSCQQVPRLAEDPYTFTEPPVTAKFFSSQVSRQHHYRLIVFASRRRIFRAVGL